MDHKTAKKGIISIYVTDQVADWLIEKADQQDRSLSNFTRRIIKKQKKEMQSDGGDE